MPCTHCLYHFRLWHCGCQYRQSHTNSNNRHQHRKRHRLTRNEHYTHRHIYQIELTHYLSSGMRCDFLRHHRHNCIEKLHLPRKHYLSAPTVHWHHTATTRRGRWDRQGRISSRCRGDRTRRREHPNHWQASWRCGLWRRRSRWLSASAARWGQRALPCAWLRCARQGGIYGDSVSLANIIPNFGCLMRTR